MPGPGKALLNVVRGFSLVQNKEHDPEGSHYRVGKWAAWNEAGLKPGLLKECFQWLELGKSNPGESEDKLDTYKGGTK